jgi:hypothetical protein
MKDQSSAAKTSQTKGRKAAIGKVRHESASSAPSNPEVAAQKTEVAAPRKRPKTAGPNVRLGLKKGISELQGLERLLLSSDIDADVLADLRDGLNRVRNTAWVAQQYIVRKENDQDSASVLSLLAGERIRAAYQLCEALADDLKRTDIQFQRGSLVQLHEATKSLTKQLNDINKRLG